MAVIIDNVTSTMRAMQGSALTPETARAFVNMALAAFREEAAHDDRARRERSLDNGYLDRLGKAGR